MITHGKVWGKTRSLFSGNNVEVHQIFAMKGGYCSKHKHKTKYNKFIVLTGKLMITIWSGDNKDMTVLTAGQECSVPPGYFHRFEALEDTHALEVYWAELKNEDIEREDVGGINKHLEYEVSEITRGDRLAIF